MSIDCLKRLDAVASDKSSLSHMTMYAYNHPKELCLGEAVAPVEW